MLTGFFRTGEFHRVIHQELMLGNREAYRNRSSICYSPNSLIIKEIIETGMKKGEFKKVDPELTVATVDRNDSPGITVKKIFVTSLLNREDSYVPYDDPKFRKRVIDHLQQIDGKSSEKIKHNQIIKH